MANVMLSSTTPAVQKPGKTFRERVDSLRKSYESILRETISLLSDQHQGLAGVGGGAADNIRRNLLVRIEGFHAECDELYKYITEKKNRVLIRDEGNPSSEDVHKHLQMAGKLSQQLADFRYYLETGELPKNS